MSNHPSAPLRTGTVTGVSRARRLLCVLRRHFDKYICSRRLRRSQRDARTAFLPILRLDDRMLEDIGVTRDDVLWAARLPLEVNAAKAMHARARNRRREASGSRRGGAKDCMPRADFPLPAVIAPNPGWTHRQRAKPYRLWAQSGKGSKQAV